MSLAIAATVADDVVMQIDGIKREVIERGKLLDVYPGEGCIQLRVRGLRTTIEYIGCRHQVLGEFPRIYETVNVLRGGEDEGDYAFYFEREGSEVTGHWPGAFRESMHRE